jgi:hypothetical protein
LLCTSFRPLEFGCCFRFAFIIGDAFPRFARFKSRIPAIVDGAYLFRVTRSWRSTDE